MVKIRGYKQGKLETYDECISLVDSLLMNQGKSNLVSKSEIEDLKRKMEDSKEKAKNGVT